MTLTLEGKFPDTRRLITGLHSLDRAFMGKGTDLGIPVGHGYEIFGTNHVGKSSFVYSLAGIIAESQNEGIVLCDFEGFDPQLLTSLLGQAKFSGKVQVLGEKKDEDQLDKMLEFLGKEYAVGILDSIGAISPIAEQAGDLGEANMGRRAFILAQFVRKALHLFRFQKPTEPRTILMVNHWYPRIGARGYDTPGGETKKYLASVRILVKRVDEFPDGSYVLKGEVKKNRWGYKDREFFVFMLAGQGLHYGLSAMYDGIMCGVVSRKKTIKIGEENMGYLATLVKEARAGNDEIFDPFVEILSAHKEDEKPLMLDDEEDTSVSEDDEDLL